MHLLIIFFILVFSTAQSQSVSLYAVDCDKVFQTESIYTDQIACFNTIENSIHGFDPKPRCLVIPPHKKNKNILALDKNTKLYYFRSFRNPKRKALARFFPEQNTIIIAINPQTVMKIAYGHELHHYFLQKKYKVADPYHWHTTWRTCSSAEYDTTKPRNEVK